MVKTFASQLRSVYLEEMSKQELDLLVIGGGITGTGIALDAQVRGLNVGLIEMQDFAAGTSSRSTKLVHGGLRYLKQLEVKLVAEVGKERAIVYENAPHVTTPEWMLLPIIQGGTFGKAATSVGLKVYDYLAGVKKTERRKMLNKSRTLEAEPLIREDKLRGSGIYVEYRTDDARLTLEVLKEAVRRGTKATNYTKAEDFIYKNGKVIGVKVVDQLTDKTYRIYAKKIVNAAGPWVDTLREKDHSKKGKYLHVTKGVHLVIDAKKFPLKQAVYFDTKDDGRMVFAIPRDGKTYVGTTDTFYNDDIVHPRMTVEDRDYLIQAVNDMFPSVQLSAQDVESSWSGLRPLIHEEGKSASEISRKDELFLSESGLLSIAGGKLTGYRKMAERVVDRVAKDLGNRQICSTDQVKLSGGAVGGSEQFDTFIVSKTKEGVQLGLAEDVAKKLTKRYGANINRVYEIIRREGDRAKTYALSLEAYATLVYGIEEEMVATPVDYFNRRVSALLFDMNWVHQWKQPVVDFMKQYLGWSEAQTIRHMEDLELAIKYATIPIDETLLESREAI